MRHEIQSTLWVPSPIDEVWNFMCVPANLARLTPALYNAQIDAVGSAHEGQKVIIRMRPFGITVPRPWVSTLSEVKASGPKRSFVDTQDSGPFAYWKHTHTFESGAVEIANAVAGAPKRRPKEPGTWIRDHVIYETPLGAAGELANSVFVERELGKLFAFRRAATLGLFASPLAS